MRNRTVAIAICGAVLALAAFTSPGHTQPLPINVLGWKDDVDPVVAPDGEFMILCEELADGSQARIRVVDLDPANGNVIDDFAIITTGLGFENGVDPIIVPQLEGTGYPVFVPLESEDGARAGIYALLLDASGHVIQGRLIHTGNLGFRPDVDGVWTHYVMPQVAFFAMETQDHSVRAVMAIDADPRPAIGGGEFGGCTLVSTSFVPSDCENSIQPAPIFGLVDGVDPVAYEKFGCCARLAVPVSSRDGTNNDIMLFDFDPHFEPPAYDGFTSVKQTNMASVRPTPFPGFAWDVDIRLFRGECGFGDPTMLVPVEGFGDAGDLYCLDQDGTAIWTLSHDSGTTLTIPGFERGVDLVPICNPGGGEPARVAVPVENAAGSDADLWIVQLDNGHLIARAEDPAINPGLTIAGYEVGVDPVLWQDDLLVLPVEGVAGPPGLIVFHPDGVAVSRVFGGAVLGFSRSVDLIVDNSTSPHLLLVPVARDDGSDANVLIGNNPPNLGGTTLEAANAGEVMADFQWDVDMGLVRKTDPGGAFLYLPEESPTGARLRILEVPTGARLAIATRAAHGLPSSLYFVGLNPLGGIISKLSDIWGLETGLDMSCGRGQISQDWQPYGGPTPGQDGDSDPTLAWLYEVGSDAGGGTDRTIPVRIVIPSPVAAPVAIRYALPLSSDVRIDIFDAGGRRVRTIPADGWKGEHTTYWDGRDESGRSVSSGVYLVRLRGDRIRTGGKLLLYK